MHSRSTGDLRKIYNYSDKISKSRGRMLVMLYVEQNRGLSVDKSRSIRLDNLRLRLNRLTIKRQDEIMRVYSNAQINRPLSPPPKERRRSRKARQPSKSPRRRPATAIVRTRPLTSPSPPQERSPSPPSSSSTSRTPSPSPPMKVVSVAIEPNQTVIQMLPISRATDDQSSDDDEEEDDGIIYPEGVTDLHPYRVVARFRRALGRPTNFRLVPILVGDDSSETLILGVESFAQEHGCELNFVGDDQHFDRSIYRAACGVVDLGSIHLLATDSLLTANFQFEMNLDYDSQITQSKDNVERFVIDFCEAISTVLSCENSNVRVFSIDKLTKKSGRSHVNFGLTTSNVKKTEQLAHNLKTRAESGFATDTILKHVKPRKYECTWKPVLTRLQIRASDLDPRYNFDYREPGVIKEDRRGGYPYYLPIGWFRHGVNVQNKYVGNDTWLGHVNADGEWPVAFHGTHSDAVSGIVQHGFLPSKVTTDLMMPEAIDQMGEEANRPGLYVATHCDGGSDKYTTPFSVPTVSGGSEQFRIVFQCRVQSGKFSTHTSPVDVGEAWRIVDPKAIRPYGILLRKDTAI